MVRPEAHLAPVPQTPAPAVVERDTVLRGVRIHWAECGAGEQTFLLVHGLGSSIAKWIDMMPWLGRFGRVVALDLPGFGESDVPPGPYTPEWLAGAVRMFAAEMGLERPVVVGNSLGGLVALCHAGAWPEHTRAVVALAPSLPAPPGTPHDPKVLAKFGATLLPGVGDLAFAGYARIRGAERFVLTNLAMNVVDMSRVPQSTIDRLVREAEVRLARPEVRRTLMTATRAMSWRMTGGRDRVARFIERLRVPVLYVWGEHDKLIDPRTGVLWTRRTPGARLVTIAGVGHNPQIESPPAFADAVASFAASLDGDPAPPESPAAGE